MEPTADPQAGPASPRGAVWRLMDVLKEAALFLETRGVESPRLNAERLLAQVLGIGRVDLYLQFDQPLSPAEREAFKAGLRRRAGGEPLQYILGETEFMSLALAVNPAVLIPRPETEILVEAVLNRFDAATPVRILDIGTGSGAIAVSLAHFLPEAEVTAVDLSKDALEVARHNAARHGVEARIRFMEADLYDPGLAKLAGSPFDAVVSNPPYVALAEWEGLQVEVRDHEPRLALCDEGDGLSAYRALAAQAVPLLKPGAGLWVEVGDSQSGPVSDLFQKAGLKDVTILSDLNAIGRVVHGVRNDL